MTLSAEMQKKTAYKISFLFTLMGALLILLSPQFLGAILGFIFIIPIYIGLNGLKGRKKIGFFIALGIVPISTAVSIMWITYYLSLGNVSQAIITISQTNEIPLNLVKFVLHGSFYGSILELVISTSVLYLIVKNRSIFKTSQKGS